MLIDINQHLENADQKIGYSKKYVGEAKDYNTKTKSKKEKPKKVVKSQNNSNY